MGNHKTGTSQACLQLQNTKDEYQYGSALDVIQLTTLKSLFI